MYIASYCVCDACIYVYAAVPSSGQMLQRWYFAVAGWQSCYYVACSLLVRTLPGYFSYTVRTNCWKKEDSIYCILATASFSM